MKLYRFAAAGTIAGSIVLGSMACQSPPETGAEPEAETPVASEEETATEAEDGTVATPAPEPTPEAAEPAAPKVAAAERSCSATAYVVDTDPAGLNVRQGPGSDYAAIDKLPTGGPVEVSIVGVASGWFLLNEAWSENQQELEQPGWVYAPLLGVKTTSLDINDANAPAPLYEAPDGAAGVKTEVPKATEVTLLSCEGNWLQVQADDTTGWLAIGDQCSDPSSDCP